MSAESLLHITCCMPNQSAQRIIVPRFPGSCMPSATMVTLFFNVRGCKSGILKTPITWLGVERNDNLSSNISSTSVTTDALSPFLSIQSFKAKISCGQIDGSPNNSLIIFGPSATKTLSASLNFLSPKLLIYLTLDLTIIAFLLKNLCFSAGKLIFFQYHYFWLQH